MRDGQHQLLAGRQQRLLVAVGLLQLPTVAVAAADVAPEHPHEQQHEHHGPDGHASQHARRPPAEGLRLLDAPHQEGRILGLEIHNQAVYLRIDQVVAVTQPQAFLPRLVVNAQAVARDTVLQGPQHQRNGVLHRFDGHHRGHQFAAGNHDARIRLRRAEQIAQPLQKAPFAPRHGHRILLYDAAERGCVGDDPLPGTDQVADILVQQAGRGTAADRAPQAHRPPLLVGKQPRDAVQTHHLQRIPVARQRPQRVDTSPHGAHLALVTHLVRLVAGDHQLTVTLGLIEVVEGAVDGAVPGLQQGVAAVGGGKTDHHPVDIPDREHTDRNQQDIACDHLCLDEFRLFHSSNIRKVSAKPNLSGLCRTASRSRSGDSAGGRAANIYRKTINIF